MAYRRPAVLSIDRARQKIAGYLKKMPRLGPDFLHRDALITHGALLVPLCVIDSHRVASYSVNADLPMH